MTRRLTPKQQRFVDEYLIDLNGTRAYRAAGYIAKGNAAEVNAARLLRNAQVAAAIQKAMNARAARTEITQDRVLERWWAIATADPNDLVQLRRCGCRYCHGKAFEYQWIDEAEFTQALMVARQTSEADAKKKKRAAAIVLPTDAGGFGFVRSNPPHPLCPKCAGEGVPEVFAYDTRQLTGAARLLYAGTKLTQAGFEIKMQDQMAALDKVARHLGMYKDRQEHGLDDDFVKALEAAHKRVTDHR